MGSTLLKNKLVVRKLSLAVGVMEGQTPTTVELSNLLLRDTERQNMREAMVEAFVKITGITLRNGDVVVCARSKTNKKFDF